MELSDCSSVAGSSSSAEAVVSKPLSTTLKDEYAKPYILQARNNISRQYNRKDDNPMPLSPVRSVVMDADDDSSSSTSTAFGEILNVQHSESDEDDEGWDHDDPMFEKRIYDSPRLVVEDHEIFPAIETFAHYQDCESRWKMISLEAGDHQQDGSHLVIRRNMKPATLKCGIVSQYFGRRVRRLTLWLDREEDILPQWLDAIVESFPNLEHVLICQDSISNSDDISVSSRMRRLYILYRLPYLLSIDGVVVSSEERELARPPTPRGAKVQATNWLQKDYRGESYESRRDKENHEVTDSLQIPANTSIGSDTAMELIAELAQLTEKLARDDASSNAELSEHQMQSIQEDLTEDAGSLFGEDILELAATSVSPSSCEEREDQLPSYRAGGNPTSKDSKISSSELPPSRIANQDNSLLDISPPPPPQSSRVSSMKSKSHNNLSRSGERVPPTGPTSRRNITKLPVRNHLRADDSYELVSVASSHHEWTAACGVLSFHSDRGACAPRLRFNFLGKGKNKKSKEKNRDQPRTAKSESTVVRGETSLDSLAPLQRIRLEQECTTNPIPSANQRLPPKKSLSSPFPMQFRERKASLHVSTNARDLSVDKLHGVNLTAPRARGSVAVDTITQPTTLTVLDATKKEQKCGLESQQASVHLLTETKSPKDGLPPPCPSTSRRKVVASSLLQQTSQHRSMARKQRRLDRKKKLFQENARSSSVMDELGEEDDSDSSDNRSYSSSGSSNSDDGHYIHQPSTLLHHGNEW